MFYHRHTAYRTLSTMSIASNVGHRTGTPHSVLTSGALRLGVPFERLASIAIEFSPGAPLEGPAYIHTSLAPRGGAPPALLSRACCSSVGVIEREPPAVPAGSLGFPNTGGAGWCESRTRAGGGRGGVSHAASDLQGCRQAMAGERHWPDRRQVRGLVRGIEEEVCAAAPALVRTLAMCGSPYHPL